MFSVDQSIALACHTAWHGDSGFINTTVVFTTNTCISRFSWHAAHNEHGHHGSVHKQHMHFTLPMAWCSGCPRPPNGASGAHDHHIVVDEPHVFHAPHNIHIMCDSTSLQDMQRANIVLCSNARQWCRSLANVLQSLPAVICINNRRGKVHNSLSHISPGWTYVNDLSLPVSACQCP
jgi:hypothetical protein